MVKKSAAEITKELNLLNACKRIWFKHFIYYKKNGQTKRAIQIIKKYNCQESDFPEFKDWETQKVVQWIQQYANKQSISITKNAINHLIELHGVTIALINKTSINASLQFTQKQHWMKLTSAT